MYVYVSSMCLIPVEIIDPLELELQVIVSYHVDDRNWTPVLCEGKYS